MQRQDPEPFSVTRAAAAQIRHSMEAGDADGMGLRIAARTTTEGGLDYRMGFDERAPGDMVVVTAGVEVLVADTDLEVLRGTVLDYVELEPGSHSFIFINPNDPNHTPPTET